MIYLLTILKEEGFDVPNSLYLFKKPNVRPKLEILKANFPVGGAFAYLSILDNMKYCIKNNILQCKQNFMDLSLKVGIDGIPIFKSSPVNIWPILLYIDGLVGRPLPVAVFVGLQKPTCSAFLHKFSEELKTFTNYVDVHGIFIKFVKVTFICDAPARAFCQGTKNHSGYNSCSYCRIPGSYCSLSKKIVFPFTETPYEKRQDQLYKKMLENNQTSLSPLADVVSLSDAFPPEYMHSVCLGVMRRLVASYMSNAHGLLRCRLSSNLKCQLNEKVKRFSHALPREFQRKIRPLNNFPYFKATEFRTILLYTGPLFFKDILQTEYYNNFLLLHFAIYVFVDPSCKPLYNNAKFCVELFVKQLKDLFGVGSQTFNAHSMLHLFDFVSNLGPLDSFSAFPFENYLYLLKQRIKSGRYVVEQTINSVLDIRSLYHDCQRGFFLSDTYPNNCVIVRKNHNLTPILITVVDERLSLVSGFELFFSNDLYDYPYPSRSLGIGVYKKSDKFVNNVNYVRKCVLFTDSDVYYVFPFANCDSI